MSLEDEKKSAIADARTTIRRLRNDQANRKAMMSGLDPNSAQAKEHTRVYANLEGEIASLEQKIRQLGG